MTDTKNIRLDINYLYNYMVREGVINYDFRVMCGKKRPYVFVRFVIFYWLRQKGYGISEIGREVASYFGRKKPFNHATVINAVKAVEVVIASDKQGIREILPIWNLAKRLNSKMQQIKNPLIKPT